MMPFDKHGKQFAFPVHSGSYDEGEARKKGVRMNEQTGIRPQEERSILINFVLDKSGSMEIIRDATIAGFNEFLRDQQQEGGSAAMTLTLFDTHFKHVFAGLPISQVRPLDRGHYAPGGNTALYDAIGHAMTLTDRYVQDHHPDQVLFVIMTDGQENASREFSRPQIMQLIEHKQLTADYEFIYLGANQDSYRVGATMGIRPGRTLDYAHSPAAASATMRRVSENVKSHRRSGEKQSSRDFFSDEMEALGKGTYEEYKARSARDAGGAATGADAGGEHRGDGDGPGAGGNSSGGPSSDDGQGVK